LSDDYAKIIVEHSQAVFQTAFRILGSAADADDVVQDVFVETLARPSKTKVENWRAFLRKLAIFRALDLRRKRQREQTIEGNSLASGVHSPFDEAVGRETAVRLRDMVADLPDREATAFALRYFEKLANPQIGEVLGISTSAVATALHKARTKLEAAISKSK
jgi:RNA polymerase sigma-70 factor (ECF subfamily)